MKNQRKDPFGVIDLHKSGIIYKEDGSMVFVDYISDEILDRYPELKEPEDKDKKQSD
ncbi:MAG: hypothetical protein PHC62_06405 [Candidatus Izemoplasmatales bacterium]|jgi:hypothetical protein|nr:hypothetical protein [Candidatus Izemoplasmatales bacterium]